MRKCSDEGYGKQCRVSMKNVRCRLANLLFSKPEIYVATLVYYKYLEKGVYRRSGN